MTKTSRQANEPGSSGSRRMILTLAGLALSTTLLSPAVFAQAPPGTQAQPGTPGQGGRQGRGGFGGRMPFAMGTVTGGDANARTITITPQTGNPRGGNQPGGNQPGANDLGGNPPAASQTIQVTPGTQFVVQRTVTAADLKFGDNVQIQGVPASITASTITAGDLPDFLQFGRGRNGGPGGGAPGAANPNAQGNNADPNAPQTPPQAFASATGKVVSTSPLTVEVNKDISIVLKLAPDAKVVKYVPTSFDKLKVGDKIIAAGQADANGMFTATGVGINMDMGFGGGRGGFGGFGAGGGFGGPGGFGPGGGGFGGGAGGFGGAGANGGRGRRNRGGTPGTPPADPNNP